MEYFLIYSWISQGFYLDLLDRHKEREGEGAADEEHGEEPDEGAHAGPTPGILIIISNLTVLA